MSPNTARPGTSWSPPEPRGKPAKSSTWPDLFPHRAAVAAFERLIADGTAVEKNTPEQLDATGTVPPAYISEGAKVDFPEDWDI